MVNWLFRDSPSIYALLKDIWTYRATYCSCNNTKDAVALIEKNNSIGISKIIESYPNLILSKLLLEVVDGLRKVFEGKQSSYFVHNGKIGYRNEATGTISTNTFAGSETMFLYFKEMDFREIEAAVCKENVGISITAGNILFSDIPKRYLKKLGLTGTLDSLRSFEDQILRENGFLAKHIIPSTFKKEPIEIVKTSVFRTKDENEYNDKICQSINSCVEKKRAVLVVFKGKKELDQFNRYLSGKRLKGSAPQILTESDELTQISEKVKNATTSETVTLMIRHYGRGTDFVCRDSIVLENGGVHVIQAFASESYSEEVQIRGRAGRQNNPGSYQKILHASQLFDFGITDFSTEPSGGWDNLIMEGRKLKIVPKKKIALDERLEESIRQHNVTTEMIEAYREGDLERAKNALYRINEIETELTESLPVIDMFGMDIPEKFAFNRRPY